jgi:hypothetical protein
VGAGVEGGHVGQRRRRPERPSYARSLNSRGDWGWSDEFPGLAGVFADREDPNPRLRTWLSGWEEWRAEADDYLEFGDHVVVLATYRGRGKGSGVDIRQEGAHVFELRDGKVVRLEIFASREKAIESVRTARAVKRDPVG